MPGFMLGGRRRLTLLAATSLGLGSLAVASPAANAQGLTCASRAAQTYAATGLGSVPVPGFVAGGLQVTPCINYTGYGTGEISLEADHTGNLFVSPAYTPGGVGVLRSTDLGSTFSLLPTTGPGGQARSREQAHSYLDPATGRLFFNTSQINPQTLNLSPGFDSSYTDNAGASWTNTAISVSAYDMLRMAAGKPVTSHLQGYPDIMYAMAPSPISTPVGLSAVLSVTGPLNQIVLRSLNGGQSWTQAGSFPISPSANGCSSSEWILMSTLAVGPDGTVYSVGRRCTQVGLAVSHDEGATWSFRSIPGTSLIPFSTILSPVADPNYVFGNALSIDSQGNLYVVYPDAKDLVRLTVSRDGGNTWSSPVVVSAPGVGRAFDPAIDVRAPGQIGIGYYGAVTQPKYNGYLAVSDNALSAVPTFTSETVNDPAQPLQPSTVDAGYLQLFTGGDLNEWIGVKFAANGELFGAFNEDMCLSGNTSSCVSGWSYSGTGNSRWQAVLGRLKGSG